jgi:hypothetical protein
MEAASVLLPADLQEDVCLEGTGTEELYTQLWPTIFATAADARPAGQVRTVAMLGETEEEPQPEEHGDRRVCRCGHAYWGTRRTPCPACGYCRNRPVRASQ